MTAEQTTTPGAYGLAPGGGDALWFLRELLTVKASARSTSGRMALIEGRAAPGPASPLHGHRREAEWSIVSDEASFLLGTEPAGFESFGMAA